MTQLLEAANLEARLGSLSRLHLNDALVVFRRLPICFLDQTTTTLAQRTRLSCCPCESRMSVDGDEYLQVYTITAAAVARAIASCRPSGPLQDTQKVVVSAKYSAEQRDVQVTGAFPHPASCVCAMIIVLLSSANTWLRLMAEACAGLCWSSVEDTGRAINIKEVIF